MNDIQKPPSALPMILVRAIFLCAILFLVGMGIFSKRGWLDWRRMVSQNADIEVKVRDLQTQKATLDAKLVALQSDAEQQEVIVRQTLGYIRPHETVLEFQ